MNREIEEILREEYYRKDAAVADRRRKEQEQVAEYSQYSRLHNTIERMEWREFHV